MTQRKYDKKQISEFGGHQVRNGSPNCATDGVSREGQLDPRGTYKLTGHNFVCGTEKPEEGQTTPGCGFGNQRDDDAIYQNRQHEREENLEWNVLNPLHLDS